MRKLVLSLVVALVQLKIEGEVFDFIFYCTRTQLDRASVYAIHKQ